MKGNSPASWVVRHDKSKTPGAVLTRPGEEHLMPVESTRRYAIVVESDLRDAGAKLSATLSSRVNAGDTQ